MPACFPIAFPPSFSFFLPFNLTHPPPSISITTATEGVLVAKKDFYSVWTYKSPEGDKDLSLPNLEVVNLLKSLKSSGYVKETFNWCVPRGKMRKEGGKKGMGKGWDGRGRAWKRWGRSNSAGVSADHMHAGWVGSSSGFLRPSLCVPFSPVNSISSFVLFPHATLLLNLNSKNRQYYYYYLTVEGIDYLRQYLNLPQDVVPQTHIKKEGRPARPAGFADRGDRPEGERERRPFDKEKRLGPDGSFAPSFGGGGFGRGGGGNREGGYRG